MNKTNDRVSGRFNTRSKRGDMRTVMMEDVKVMGKMWKCSEINRGTRIEIGRNRKIQNACFKHIMLNNTTRP